MSRNWPNRTEDSPDFLQPSGMELLISAVLRIGVLISLAIVATGGFIYLIRHHADPLSYAVFRPQTGGPFADFWTSALHFDGRALIQLGLLVLVATPVARVATAAVGFAAERDWLYVGVSLIVLAILGYSMVHAM